MGSCEEYNIFGQENECVICLSVNTEGEEEHELMTMGNIEIVNNNIEIDNDKKIKCIDKINMLHKDCSCNYYVHEKCLQDWMSSNPSCPYCHEPIYFVEKETNIRSASRIRENNIDNRSIDNRSINRNANHNANRYANRNINRNYNDDNDDNDGNNNQENNNRNIFQRIFYRWFCCHVTHRNHNERRR